MAMYFEAAVRCDPSRAKHHAHDHSRAFDAFRQRSAQPQSPHAGQSTQQDDDPHSRSAVKQQELADRLNALRMRLTSLRGPDADLPDAHRSVAHTLNTFDVVVGRPLPKLVADLSTASYWSLSNHAVAHQGTTRRGSDRCSRNMDMIHAQCRARLLQECVQLRESDPRYSRPLPPLPMLIIREDGDAWRRSIV